MEIKEVSMIGKVGILGAIIVIVSLLLPWIVVNVDLLSISEPYSGFQIFEFENFDYNLFPIIVMILAALSILYFYLDVKTDNNTSAIVGIALGLGVVILSYLTYDNLTSFGFSFGGLEVVVVSMGYGLYATLIGGAAIIVAAVLNK